MTKAMSRGLILGFLAILPATAARADLYTLYDVTIDAGFGDVDGITIMEKMPPFGQLLMTFPDHAPEGETTEINGLTDWGSAPPLGAALLGVILNPDITQSGDVVLMVSDAAASLMEGKPWETFFPSTYPEYSIANALELMNTQIPGVSYWESITLVHNFTRDYLTTGIWNETTGQATPYMFQLGDSFSVIRFSDGEIIGHGTSRLVSTSTVVPEPSSVTLLATGSALAGFAIRRRARRGKQE